MRPDGHHRSVVDRDFGFERHVSLIWRSWCHAHDARYCVRVTIGGTRVLVPKRFCVRVVVSLSVR